MSDDRMEDSNTQPLGSGPAPASPQQPSPQPAPGAPRPQSGPAAPPSQYPPPYAAYGPQGQPYGQPAPPPPPMYAPEKPMSGLAITAMVCGGVSVFFWPLAPIAGLIGVITGFMGMKQSKQPHGTHKGWGLALAGVITSAIMWLIAVAAIVGIVFLVVFVDKEQKRQRERMQQTEQTRQSEQVSDDLNLIRERMQTYFIENNNSLEPGGPIVNDGRSGLYPEDAPRVEGKLKLDYLVTATDLGKPLSEYKLVINGKAGATVTHTPTGTKLVVEDIGAYQWSIEESNP